MTAIFVKGFRSNIGYPCLLANTRSDYKIESVLSLPPRKKAISNILIVKKNPVAPVFLYIVLCWYAYI